MQVYVYIFKFNYVEELNYFLDDFDPAYIGYNIPAI